MDDFIKILKDRLNALKSEKAQYTHAKLTKRITSEIVQVYDIRINEVEKLLQKVCLIELTNQDKDEIQEASKNS